MKKLTSLERVLTAIRRQEPDRIPTFEAHIDSKVRDKIKPGLSYPDFVEYMDLDALVLFSWEGDKYEVIDESKRLVRDKWGAISRFGEASELNPVFMEAPIKSEDDIKGYVPPDPDVSGAYKVLEQWVKRFKGKRAVIAQVDDPGFALRDHMLGQVEYFKAIKTSPDLIDRLSEIAVNYYLRYIANCIDMGVDIVWMTTDLATNLGPFLSPEDTQRFIMPNNRKIIQYAKSKGLPCLRHSDGNIWKLFDMLIDVGFDAIHPIDPTAGMDLGEAKAKYGDKVCLMGNVDCTYIMTWGTTDEVREDVKRCIRQAAKGGGYICTTSNSVHSATKPENYVAMVEAIKEYGKYPISL
jgi:uroporphyrinogen decarboxylase